MVLLSNPRDGAGSRKRLLQAASMVVPRSYERLLYTVPALQRALDEALARQVYDLVSVEFPYLAHYRLRTAPAGQPRPRLVLDEHNVEYDLLRQVAGGEIGLGRRIYTALNWRKLRREETEAWRTFDGVTVTSPHDEAIVRAAVPGGRTAIIPNAVDVESFRPAPGDPAPDGRTLLFFGAINYFPNTDGILHFLRDTWPLVAARHPEARVKIVGHRPPPSVLEYRGPRVEVTGFVEDLRPHLASAAAVIVPLRMGSGTRLRDPRGHGDEQGRRVDAGRRGGTGGRFGEGTPAGRRAGGLRGGGGRVAGRSGPGRRTGPGRPEAGGGAVLVDGGRPSPGGFLP